MKRTGLVLSGGGARGFAHLGIMKLLEELDIYPYAVSGTSVGAVIGALYAAGKKPLEILAILKNKKYFGWHSFTLLKEGFFSMGTLKKILEENIETNDFNALEIKLFVAATDLVKAEPVYFSKGELFNAVIASASIPVLFEPVRMGDRLLVDGGVMNNFPIEPIESTCDVIIGSNVNMTGSGFKKNSFFKTVDILDRCFHLAIANTVYSKAGKCDVFIETALQEYNSYDVKNADRIFEAGYMAALRYKEKLMELAKTGLRGWAAFIK